MDVLGHGLPNGIVAAVARGLEEDSGWLLNGVWIENDALFN